MKDISVGVLVLLSFVGCAGGSSTETPSATETIVPDACLNALEAARELGMNASQMAEAQARFTAWSQKSFNAALDRDFQLLKEIKAEGQSIVQRIKEISGALDGETFWETSAECEDIARESRSG